MTLVPMTWRGATGGTRRERRLRRLSFLLCREFKKKSAEAAHLSLPNWFMLVGVHKAVVEKRTWPRCLLLMRTRVHAQKKTKSSLMVGGVAISSVERFRRSAPASWCFCRHFCQSWVNALQPGGSCLHVQASDDHMSPGKWRTSCTANVASFPWITYRLYELIRI